MVIKVDSNHNAKIYQRNIGDNETAQIIEYIHKATCLKSLHMYGSCINDNNARKIATAVCNNKLIHNLCFVASACASFSSLVEMVEILLTGDKLYELKLQYNFMSDDEVVQLSKLLVLSDNLRVLEIFVDTCVTNGMDYLVKAISIKKSLKALAIQYRGGINRYISILLNECDHLQEMHLMYCRIDDNDADAIAKLLSRNNYLHVLNLTGNYITTHGAITIAKALCHNETLVELKLQYNNILREETYQIESILISNYTLMYLTLVRDDDNYPCIINRNKSLLEQKRFVKVKPITNAY